MSSTNSMIAKKYLKSICCRSEFDKFIKDIILNKIEYIAIVEQFRDNKTVSTISIENNLSESTIRKYQHDALIKIYKFMKIKGIDT